jgi:hypothetical protein
MSVTVLTLIAVLAVWMLLCAWCGYRARYLLFVGVLLGGLALNLAWMVFGLKTHPFDIHALSAQMAAVLYAVGAFGCGWLVGRFARRWQDSRVEDRGI